MCRPTHLAYSLLDEQEHTVLVLEDQCWRWPPLPLPSFALSGEIARSTERGNAREKRGLEVL